jgi:MFS family permease
MRHHIDRNIKLMLIATLLYGFSISVWELFFNLYILSLNISSDMLGLIRSATPLAALVLGLPLGLLTDRISRRSSMLIGLIVLFIGMLLQVHIPNPFLILIFGLFQGAGFMLFQVAQPPFIMANSKQENQVLIFSLNYGLMTLAITIGNLVAGYLPTIIESRFNIPLSSAQSYQWVLTAGILLAATSLIPVLLIRKSGTPINVEKTRIPIKTVIFDMGKKKPVRRLAATNVLIGLGAGFLIPYLNVFLKVKFEISDNTLGLIFSMSYLIVFLALMASPWLVKMTRSRIIPVVSTQGLGIFFLIAMGFSPSITIVTISLLVRGALMQMSAPMLDTYAMLISKPEERGTVSSIRGMGWQLGQTVGISASGFIQAHYGFSPLFLMTAILYGLATVLTWVWFRPGEKELAESPT